MHRIGVFAAMVSVLFLTLPLQAQGQPGEIAQFFLIKPKPGMLQQFEEATKQHVEWHRQQDDTWTWRLWQYETGDLYGQYVYITPGHRWEDFDTKAEFRKRDTADAIARIGPYTDSVTSWFSRLHGDISHLPEGGILDPKAFPLVMIIDYQVHESKIPDFLHTVGKIHEALQKAHWPVYYLWTQVVAGREGSIFTLVLPQRNWADLTPPEKQVPMVLEEVLGRQEGESLIEAFDDSVASSQRDILSHKPDLSYEPSGQ